MNNELTTHFFPASCGDAIHIRFYGNDNQWHNIFIDSGYTETYEDYLLPRMKCITCSNEIIDLWVITHIDQDHIEGIIAFIEDKTNWTDEEKNNLVKEYWFNWSETSVKVNPDASNHTGVKEGIDLRDYLISINKHQQKDITIETSPINLFGANITILSPTQSKLNTLTKKWDVKEQEIYAKKTSGTTATPDDDYDKSIEELINKAKSYDPSPANGSSIAFLFEHNDTTILFLADSHHNIIEKSLKNLRGLEYSKNNPIKVDYVKVSHHGSKYNTSQSLLEIIDCKNFIITADGSGDNHRKPYKETLAHIIQNREGVKIYFNHNNHILRGIFSDDEKTNHFQVIFQESFSI